MDLEKTKKAWKLINDLWSLATALWEALSKGDDRQVDDILSSQLASQVAMSKAELEAKERYNESD